jgi:hypothetical protein
VFNPKVKKWIDVNGATSEKIIEQVKNVLREHAQ